MLPETVKVRKTETSFGFCGRIGSARSFFGTDKVSGVCIATLYREGVSGEYVMVKRVQKTQLSLLRIILLLVSMFLGSEARAEGSHDDGNWFVPVEYPVINGVTYKIGMQTYPAIQNDNVELWGTSSENYGDVSIPGYITWHQSGGGVGVNITYIRDHAFYDLKTLRTLSIPSTVTRIDVPVCLHCSSLTEFKIAYNPNFSVENGVLFNKDKMVLKKYPEGKTGSTYTVPSSVTSLSKYAFAYTKLISEPSGCGTKRIIVSSSFICPSSCWLLLLLLLLVFWEERPRSCGPL